MKIAVCLSGHMRTYRETAASLHENLLIPLAENDHYDVFIYACRENDMSANCLKNPDKSPLKPTLLTEEDIRLISEIYQPKKLVFDDNIDPTGLGRQPMLRRIGMCDKLRISHEKELNINYDLVIRARHDTFFVEKFDPLKIEHNEITFLKYGRHHGGYYDGFAIGSADVMKKYSEFYLHSEAIRIRQEGHGHIKIEKALKAYIDSLGFKVSYIDKATYTLRSWGQKYTFFDQDPQTYRLALDTNK